MHKTVAVFHEGAVAHYDVSEDREGQYKARLLKYNGSPQSEPPREFLLCKKGRHWNDEGIEQNLADDIGYAIEIQIRSADGPVYYNRDRKRGESPSPDGG